MARLISAQAAAVAAGYQKILGRNGIVECCWTGALAYLGVARTTTLLARNSQYPDVGRARALVRHLLVLIPFIVNQASVTKVTNAVIFTDSLAPVNSAGATYRTLPWHR